MGFTVSQIGNCLKEEFEDLVILAQYTVGWVVGLIQHAADKIVNFTES